MELIVFCGIQASGKSTFYRLRFFETHLRINLDTLRTRHREAALLRACLETGQRCVIDNTNPTPDDRARYIAPARAAGFRVVGYYFRSHVPECLPRNAARSGSGRVPDAALWGTAGRLVLPRLDEGFDNLYYVAIDPTNRAFIVEEWREDSQA